ncbi:selenocysteine-specific translation elongation factor [Nonomuraea wenchangensis]
MHVVATAGHVDHGKSTLVRVLTGMEPDRWAEERRRGLTIDLGFAWRTLPSGRSLALVDVPGHERFVGNMLAGIGPVPAVMMVVAADEGWMPQSAEHLAVIDALGVEHGLLVVTRADRADPELAEEEARLELDGTSLRHAEAVAVSSVTGQGVDALVAALDRLSATLPVPPPEAPVRLWIDRAFTVKGLGTVVTGTLPQGTLSVGDELLLGGTGRRVRVRGLQSLKRQVDSVTGVARVALNLKGVELSDVPRGVALVTPERWTATQIVDIRLRPSNGTIGRECVLHIGSASIVGRLRRLGEDIARLTLTRPVPLHVGDRAILRDPGSRAVAGVTVLDVRPPSLVKRGSAARAARELSSWPAVPTSENLVRRHRFLREAELALMGRSAESDLVAGTWLVDPAHWAALGDQLEQLARSGAERDPLRPGLSVEVARQALGLPDKRLVEALVRAPLRVDAGRVLVEDAAPLLPAGVLAAVDRLRAELATHPFRAPESARLGELGLTGKAVAAGVRAGVLIRLAEGVVLPRETERKAVEILAGLRQPFTAGEARSALDTSRRVVIPLLEHLDELGHTERVDAATRRVTGRP